MHSKFTWRKGEGTSWKVMGKGTLDLFICHTPKTSKACEKCKYLITSVLYCFKFLKVTYKSQ